MIHYTLISEDQVIIVNVLDGERITVTVSDSNTGIQETVDASCEEVGAAMALMCGSDEIPGSDELYPLAEELMDRLEAAVDERQKDRRDKVDAKRILRFIP